MAPSEVRDRSRSPSRTKKSSGFKWKDKASTKSTDRSEARSNRDAKSSSTSHRERSEKYDTRRRSQSPRHDSDSSKRYRDRDERDDTRISTKRERQDKREDAPVAGVAAPPAPTDRTSVAAKFGAKAAARAGTSKPASNSGTTNGAIADKDKDSALMASAMQSQSQLARPPPPSNEPMIIVYVNDRLGTKAAIPCLASDPVKAFKAMVAARIGRQSGEIMLKRQGERPFKDQLTLEDYGVSNGVQLDLELDTGD